MDQSLALVTLGANAMAYVRRCLADSGPLGRAALACIDGAQVRTWAPSTIAVSALDEGVDRGGVLAPADRRANQYMVRVPQPSRSYLLGFIEEYLNRESTCFIVDDPWLLPADIRDVGRYKRALAYGESSVAHLLPEGSKAEAIDEALRHVLTYEWCGILSRTHVSPSALRGGDDELVHQLIAACEYLVVAAFDHEGWLLVETHAGSQTGASSDEARSDQC